jgi:peptide/nickel transport system substrate-binding protein
MRRTKRLVALAAGLGLVATACGGDDDNASTAAPTTQAATATTSAATTATTAAGGGGAATTAPGSTTPASGLTVPSGATAMTLTVNLDPKAVWEDGSPITVADLECTWQANLQTPGSVTSTGYDQITSVDQGTSDKQAVINFKSVYGPYKILFNPIIKKAAVKDCTDVSGDFDTFPKFSGRPYMLQSWGQSQSVFVPNPKYWGTDKPKVDKFVMVPQTDQDTEVASIKAGQVDYIYPQFGDALGNAIKGDSNIKVDIQTGAQYEGIYFQVKDGPLADPIFRQALSESIDRQALFDQIYGPIFESAGAEGKLNNCGPIVEGPWCPVDNFHDTYNPDDATKILTDAGWTKNGQGFWAKDGDAPEIRWMINSGNTRRENTQAYLIPLLAQAGFNVKADNCDNACVFQQRQPALDYDIGMYIQTPQPDPQYLTPILACDQIPTPENGNRGQNFQGWCNQEASDQLHKADATVDQAERQTLVKDALKATATDHVMLPLVTYPNSGIWRTDKVGGPITAETANYRAFSNFQDWTDVDGDGQIVMGAEQWPECLNPVTQCQNSSWMVWTINFPLMPGIWDSTNDQQWKLTNLVTGEPEVKIL